MADTKKTTRREFFTRGAQTAAVLGLGGVTAQGATRKFSGYRAANSFATGAAEVRGIAVGANDLIYVAADKMVLIFGPDGAERGRIELDDAPVCVAERDGEILVGMKDHVEVFDAAGRSKAVWPSLGSDASLTSMAVSEKGHVFVSDGAQQVIWHLGRDGAVIRKIDREGKKFAVPRDFFPIAVSGDKVVAGNLGRHSIETLDSEGKLLSMWGERSRGVEGFGGCCNPVSFAMTPDGHFVTAEGGLPRIKIFDAQGKFTELVAGPEELESNARGSHETTRELSEGCQTGGLEVAVDSTRRILVLDRVTSEVRVFAQA